MSETEDVAKYYKRKQIESATPGQLIVLLYEGAIDHLNQAESSLSLDGPQKIEKFHNHLITCQDIITELMSSLDMERGGEIAENLFRLYDFMHYRLIDANMTKETKAIDEVRGLLSSLKDTWAEVVKKEASLSIGKEPPRDGSGLNLKG